ncbi:hypothetical protein [Burkholderia puraquae]|uniref:hypothetical protein n=1 Tax=Burkholderia puraquae TaxID=1904757 RepID=UPI001FCC81CA|nr:hypothetical protein [Burkholderia puraquae]
MYAEDLHAGCAAARPASMFVAAGRDAELVAAFDHILVQPAEVALRRRDLDEPFKLGVVPVRN